MEHGELGFALYEFGYCGRRKLVSKAIKKLWRVGCQDYLSTFSSVESKLCNDGEHSGVQTCLWLVDCDEVSGLGIGQYRHQHQKAKGAVREARGRLLGIEMLPSYAELNSLIRDR